MKALILYTTAGCHLCEQAKALLLACVDAKKCVLKEVDIADSEVLMTRYGVTIPVLAEAETGESGKEELVWPFGAGEVRAWLKDDRVSSN